MFMIAGDEEHHKCVTYTTSFRFYRKSPCVTTNNYHFQELQAKNEAANAKLRQMVKDQQEAEKKKVESQEIQVSTVLSRVFKIHTLSLLALQGHRRLLQSTSFDTIPTGFSKFFYII